MTLFFNHPLNPETEDEAIAQGGIELERLAETAP